jgi:UDP:flavonoid glycosyltransferase YjiC (YdhE family)
MEEDNMTTTAKNVRIVITVALQDAGEATRALELARGIRDYRPEGWTTDIIFLSHGSRFAEKVTAAGFRLYDCQPQFQGISFREDLQAHDPEFVGTVELAGDLIRRELDALSTLKPDLVLHGFWPSTGIARQMLGLPGICFLPLPLHPEVVTSPTFLKDEPDAAKPLTYLPLSMRGALARRLPASFKLNSPGFAQRNLRLGAQAAGWTGPSLHNLLQMLHADLMLVNDLPDFYVHEALPENICLVGPLFAPSEQDAEVDPAIARLFARTETRPKIFCTMGSSGSKQCLLEAITALTTGKAAAWNSVILAPPAICPLAEAMERAGEHQNVYLTEAFVPALTVNAMADIVVCHGGQGTVQTALACGTPIVAVAMQMEQQMNLDHVAATGAGIRIPITRWTARNIQKAVGDVMQHPSYRESAHQLQQRLLSIDGKKNASLTIWKWITEQLHQTQRTRQTA